MLDYNPIDPDSLYPSEGLRGFEHAALEALEWRSPHLLARTRDAIEIRFPDTEDDDLELMILLSPEGAELRLPTVEWTMGSYGPARTSYLWKRVSLEEILEAGAKGQLNRLRAALKRRRRRCKRCNERFLTSRMTGATCHGRASKFNGVVY